MKEILAEIASCLSRRFNSMLDEAGKLEIVTMLFFIQNDIRLNQLATPTQVQELWESFREQEAVVDFLHGGSQEMRFMLGPDSWTSLIVQLADAFTVHYESSLNVPEEEAFGEDLMERMVSKANLADYLTTYPWLVLVFLLDFLDLDKILDGQRPDGAA